MNAVMEPSKINLENNLMAMYTRKLEDAAKVYYDMSADFVWLRENKPGAYHAVNMADFRLNAAWLQCLAGKANIEKFEQAVSAWYQTVMNGIELCKAVPTSTRNAGQDKTEVRLYHEQGN
jgi:hypothetical protein